MSVYLKPPVRTIKRGMSGRDVLATKYAMRQEAKEHGYRIKSLVLTNRAGLVWQAQVNRIRHAHKLGDGPYDAKVHGLMRPYMAKVPYAVWLWNGTVKPTVSATTADSGGLTKRQVIVNAALFGAQREPYIHYTQSSSRMYGVRNRIRPPAIPRYEDCSSFATWCYWLAGAADPNGLGYNGQGYTGTLAAHGRRVSTSELRPGDLVFYGGGFPYTHVVVYIGRGRVVSHGSESGPKVTSVFYRTPSACRSYLP